MEIEVDCMEVSVLIEGVHNDRGKIEGTTVANSINPICSSVTLLKGEQIILVDTGYLGYEKEIITRLEEQGITPDDVDIIFNTHSHFDHCFNNYLFLNAKVIFGRSEWSLKKCNVMSEVKIPGLTIMQTPGHSQDHQSILVRKDKNYVIAGDAVREDIIRDDEKWKSIVNDDYIRSVKRIFEVADIIIPGHGRVIQGEVFDQLMIRLTKKGC